MAESRLRWHQRASFWAAVAIVAIPLSLVSLTLYLTTDFMIIAFVSPIVSAFAPVGLWMAALVSKRGWTQFLFVIATAVLFATVIWSVSAYLDQLEFDSCATIPGDAELCQSLTSGSFQRTVWISFTLFWFAPLAVLYALRKRFQPDRLQNFE